MTLTSHEFPLPNKLAPETLRVIPLGGIGEIGRNMTVFEIDGKILIVDVGVLFPEEHQPGIDVILPDFSYLKDRLDDVVVFNSLSKENIFLIIEFFNYSFSSCIISKTKSPIR